MERFKIFVGAFALIIMFTGISYSQIILTLPSVSGAPGTTISNAPVMVSDLTGKNISSFQFQINYDKTKIKIIGAATAGTMLSNTSVTFYADTVNGFLRMAWAYSEPLAGKGTLLHLKMNILENGSSEIIYSETGVYPNGEIFTSTFGDGTHIVTGIKGTVSAVEPEQKEISTPPEIKK